MSSSSIGGGQSVGHRIGRFIRRCRGELSSCRECGDRASVFDPICPHCGAGNPVRIPISPSVVVTAIGAQVAIVILRIA